VVAERAVGLGAEGVERVAGPGLEPLLVVLNWRGGTPLLYVQMCACDPNKARARALDPDEPTNRLVKPYVLGNPVVLGT
jgi:hypothetical protein